MPPGTRENLISHVRASRHIVPSRNSQVARKSSPSTPQLQPQQPISALPFQHGAHPTTDWNICRRYFYSQNRKLHKPSDYQALLPKPNECPRW